MTTTETTLVRELIEECEPIEDLELNYRLVAEGIDPHDAIVIQDLGRVAKRSRLCRWYSQLRGHS